MPSVHDVLENKGAAVHTIGPTATVLAATMKMNRHRLGALVVVAEDQVVGMFTERDVLRRVVGEKRDPATMRVEEAMTDRVICCSPEMDLDEVAAIMKDARVRHLPVVSRPDGDEGDPKLVGVISIGDVNAQYATSQEATIEFLNSYIYGRA